MQRVEWSQVKEAAKLAFSVWVDQPEMSWAEQNWYVLASVGLTEYEPDDLAGEYRVYFRLLVLGGIYRDFCDRAWEEYSDRETRDYESWAEPLKLDPRIVRAVASSRAAGIWTMRDDEFEEYEASPDAALGEDVEDEPSIGELLYELVEAERSGVVNALKKGLGGEALFFASLYRSRGDGESVFEVPSAHPFPLRVDAYAWVADGCPEV